MFFDNGIYFCMDTKIPNVETSGLEKRRMKAATLFERGCIQADVARKQGQP